MKDEPLRLMLIRMALKEKAKGVELPSLHSCGLVRRVPEETSRPEGVEYRLVGFSVSVKEIK